MPRGVRPASTRFLESVVSLITWRPRCSEEAAVPVSGQSAVKGSRCFKAGTFVGRTNRLANSVQTHFFDTGSAAAVGRQGRWTQRSFVWLATGSGRWKVENFDSNGCVHRARAAGRRRRCIAGCAELRAGEATYARGRKCENALELRGKRVPAEFPGQAIARESTLAKGDGVMGALGCTQGTRGSRRVGSALE